MAAWGSHPSLLLTAEAPTLTDTKVDETVDILCSINHMRLPVAVGEWKRLLIDARDWQAGKLTHVPQQRLSREIRG